MPSSHRTYSLCANSTVSKTPQAGHLARAELGTHFCSFHSARSGIKSASAELTPRSSRYVSNSDWTPSSRLSNCTHGEPGGVSR